MPTKSDVRLSRRANDRVAFDYCDGVTLRLVTLPRDEANRLLGFKETTPMPAKSEKQRKMMGTDLARAKAGKKTKTGMSTDQLRDFAKKPTRKRK